MSSAIVVRPFVLIWNTGSYDESYMSLNKFYNYVAAKNRELPGLVNTAFDRFIDKAECVRHPVSTSTLIIYSDVRLKLTSEEEDAYLVQAMLPIYDKVRRLKGKLIHQCSTDFMLIQQ